MASPTVPADASDDAPRLLLGPMLRHVTPTSATVWVEVDRPCRVCFAGAGAGAGSGSGSGEGTASVAAQARTFTISGHHYALVVARDLTPGTVLAYRVLLDGHEVWPQPGAPSSVLRVPPQGARPVTLAFGSCRFASPSALAGSEVAGRPGLGRIGPDALDALARRVAADPAQAPDLLLLLGDQVYADETTPATRARIAERRGARSEPRGEVADFEEYTWLYHESWTDPEVRRLFSCVPTAMVFDDHDVHDDWNTSGAWRRDARATPWWGERIVAALESAWVYQHLGNLSPGELDDDPRYRALLELPPGEDGEPLLRALALAADAETDDPEGADDVDPPRGPTKGYRWSYARDLDRTRVVVVDSRCGRILDGDRRAMLSDADLAWLADVVRGDYDHLVLATSLPWLLAPALHELEAFSERLAASPRARPAAVGERLRRALDLEHWAAFGESFERLTGLLRDLAAGGLGRPAPRSVVVLSGDVHHSYLARVRWPASRGRDPARECAPTYQVTCSPLHQAVPRPMRWTFRASWSAPAGLLGRALRRAGRRARGSAAATAAGAAAEPRLSWRRVGGGPWLGNALGTLVLDGPRAWARLESSEHPADDAPFTLLVDAPLTRP